MIDDGELQRILTAFDHDRPPPTDVAERIEQLMLDALGEATGDDPGLGSADVDVVELPYRPADPRPGRTRRTVALIVAGAAAVALSIALLWDAPDQQATTTAQPTPHLAGDAVVEFCKTSLPPLVEHWVRADAVIDARSAEDLRELRSLLDPLDDLLAHPDVVATSPDAEAADRMRDLLAVSRTAVDNGRVETAGQLLDALRLELRSYLSAPALQGGASCDTSEL